jgi:DNA-binding transcriptional ArsR family regulator
MGNATRLEIVHTLREGPKRGSDLAALLGLSQPTVSRHISVLRNAGILACEREPNGLFYHIANPKISSVCDLMREVLAEQYAQQSQLIDMM